MINMKDYFKQVSSQQYITHVGGMSITVQLVNSQYSLSTAVFFIFQPVPVVN